MKIKRILVLIISVIAVIGIGFGIEQGIHYYHNPIKEAFEFLTTAQLIYNNDDEYETVKAKVIGEKLNYYFNNNDDAIQGDILIDGVSIYGRDQDDDEFDNPYINGFYTVFRDSEYATLESFDRGICQILVVSKNYQAIICAIVDVTGKEALLVISKKPVDDVIKKVIDKSPQLKEWLDKYDWEL